MKLIQKQGFNMKKFEIIDDILKIKTKTYGESKKWTVKIEDLGHEKLYQTHTKIGATIVGIIFIAFILFTTVAFLLNDEKSSNIWILIGMYALFGSMGWYLLWIPKKSELHLIGGLSSVTFFSNSPSEEEVERFVDTLIEKSKQIILSKYGKVDFDLPEETQMNQLNWLKNRNLISEEVYEKLKRDYKLGKIIN